MVVQVDNPANKQMHYGTKPPVGTISAPDRLPSKIIYSEKDALDLYNKIQTELYYDEQRAKAKSKRKFPLVLKILFGMTGAASLIIFRKDLGKFLKGLVKNPFKSNP